ncbi:AMP-binding protein, partial [Streptomyces sp. NPDC002073]
MPVGSRYAAKPWLGLLSAAQLAPVSPAPSVLRAFRDAVGRAPERVALAYFDGRVSYREADALSDSIAGHLAARGVRAGDRVAVMLQNTPHFVLAVLAAWKAGAIVVPVNPMYRGGEVAHVLRDAEPAALICSDRAWETYLRATVASTAAPSPADRDTPPASPAAVVQPPALPAGVAQSPALPAGVAQSPALPAGVAQSPALPAGVAQPPALPAGGAHPSALPAAVAQPPALPAGEVQFPASPAFEARGLGRSPRS